MIDVCLSEADMVDHHIENLKSLSLHPINPIIATGHHEDEISMVDAKLLDLLEGLACNLRGNRHAGRAPHPAGRIKCPLGEANNEGPINGWEMLGTA